MNEGGPSMSRAIALALILISLTVAARAAPQLVYLSCDLPATSDGPAEHYDFTLNEQNRTVAFYVNKAEATSKEKAVFGPATVTWKHAFSMGATLTRTINRTDLTFTEDLELLGDKSHKVGQCTIDRPSD